MTGRERGFLLLTSSLGDPERRVLTSAQLRTLADRARRMPEPEVDRDLTARDLMALGYGPEMAGRILSLLEEEDRLDYYLHRGKMLGCVPITRSEERYPLGLRKRLGAESPGCLWARGDLSLLNVRAVALVGSRDIGEENRAFAEAVGRQAAIQGYALVSGNARGSDRAGQDACLEAGGRVISIVADPLTAHRERENVLFLSENGYDDPFTAYRALSRNRCIHAMGEKTFVAQCSLRHGGTWDGTVKNLRFHWSSVYCFRDGSEAVQNLAQMGAVPLGLEDLGDFAALPWEKGNLFDQ